MFAQFTNLNPFIYTYVETRRKNMSDPTISQADVQGEGGYIWSSRAPGGIGGR